MNVHDNARLSVFSREQIVIQHQQGARVMDLSRTHGVSCNTIYKWLRRYRTEGLEGLRERSSRPRRLRHPTSLQLVEEVERLRRQRLAMWKIAVQTGLSRSTVARICGRAGLSRLKNLDEKPPVIRYEKTYSGELIHIDMKKLGRINGVGHRMTGDRKGQSSKRGTGWEIVHLAIDDYSRLAYSEVLPDETRLSCLRFFKNALRFFRSHGVRVKAVMTDNGSAFKSHAYTNCLKRLNIKHRRTRAYRPQTNGKAERFVQTSLREWAYAMPYETSEQRSSMVKPFIDHYNHHRPHAALNGKPPISRITVNNLLRHDI